ncbi:MAG: phosphatase PAP2 family protein [Lachnospiraceae bacterium]|nr:phosphatase PAP2 family protein [Lachnospiraceae bacterium]
MEGVTFYYAFEPALMEWLQSGMGPVLTAIASILTMCGEEAVVVGILGFLYWVWDKEAAVFMGTNVLVGTVWNPMLKNLALRRRPYFDHPSIRCLKPVHAGDIFDIAAQGYSFPSGHSSNAVILYGSMPYAYKNARGRAKTKALRILFAIAFGMPFLIGLSRVMLGVHYPTDVLCGWLLGIVVIVVVSFLQRHMKAFWQMHLLLVAVSVPGFFYCQTNDYYTCFGIMCGFFLANELDERFVLFESTRKPPAIVCRMAIGLAFYFGLNTLFKVPFSAAFLSSATKGQFLVRTVRYFLVSFLMLGVYPAFFKKIRFLS